MSRKVSNQRIRSRAWKTKQERKGRNQRANIFLICSSVSCMIIFLCGYGQVVNSQMHAQSSSRKPSWARFCGKDVQNRLIMQDIFSDRCRAGGWFAESQVKWKCLCTMGTWALRFSWCQSEKPVTGFASNGYGRFTSPELSCFRIADDVIKNQTLEGILSLGKWSNRYKEGTPMIWTKATGGTLLTMSDLTLPRVKRIPLTNVTSVYALRSLPISTSFWSIINGDTKRAVCLMPPKKGETGTLFSYKIDHLWNVGRRTYLDFEFLNDCDQKQEDFDWIKVQPQSLQEFVLPSLATGNIDPDCSECLRLGSPFDPPSTTEKCYPNDLDNMTALVNEVDLQSERLAQHLGEKILLNKTGAVIIPNMTEMFFLTKGAMMAFGACNMNHIPKQFYQFFLILVEALLSESHAKNPPSPMTTDNFEKINNILDMCMSKTKPIKIHVDKSCPPTYDTYEAPGFEKSLKADIFEEILADPRKHDYIMEFLFKMVSFLHYHCYPYFQENPILHDVLQVQLESVFRDDLLMRWIYPSNSFAMLNHLFKIHFDLKVTMENMEKCVVMTHHIKNYKGILKKPINQPHVTAKLDRRRRSIPSESDRPSPRQRQSQLMPSSDHFSKIDRYRRRRQKYFKTTEFQPLESQSQTPMTYTGNYNHDYYSTIKNNFVQQNGRRYSPMQPSNSKYKHRNVKKVVPGSGAAKRVPRQYEYALVPNQLENIQPQVVDYYAEVGARRDNKYYNYPKYGYNNDHYPHPLFDDDKDNIQVQNLSSQSQQQQSSYKNQTLPSQTNNRNNDNGYGYVRAVREGRVEAKTTISMDWDQKSTLPWTGAGEGGYVKIDWPKSKNPGVMPEADSVSDVRGKIIKLDWPKPKSSKTGSGGADSESGGKENADREIYVDWPISGEMPGGGRTGKDKSTEYIDWPDLEMTSPQTPGASEKAAVGRKGGTLDHGYVTIDWQTTPGHPKMPVESNSDGADELDWHGSDDFIHLDWQDDTVIESGMEKQQRPSGKGQEVDDDDVQLNVKGHSGPGPGNQKRLLGRGYGKLPEFHEDDVQLDRPENSENNAGHTPVSPGRDEKVEMGSSEWFEDYNGTTGIFLGDNSFACLDSLSEFADSNTQYPLYDEACWDVPKDGMRPKTSYLLDIF